MKNKFLLLVAALVLSTTVTFASNTAQNSPASDATVATRRDDMITKVKEYMNDQGVMVVYVTEELGTQNYLVKDSLGKWYRVYVCENVITGFDDFDL
jgi:hypothetical protein